MHNLAVDPGFTYENPGSARLTSLAVDLEIISTVSLSIQLIQEGQLLALKVCA